MVATPTPTTPDTSGALSRLPTSLSDLAARRTVWVCLSCAVLVPVIQVLHGVAQPGLFAVAMNDTNRLMALATVLSAVGLFALQRYRVVAESTIVALGLAFEVLGAFTVSLIETAVPIRGDQPILGVSALAPWILAFGVVIPNRPLWTLIAGAAAAFTWPVAYAVNRATLDYAVAPWRVLLVWPVLDGLIVVVTYLIGRATFVKPPTPDNARALGSYRLVARIGEGGVGEVWRANHRWLARPAAIKLIRKQEMSGRQADQTERRFRREAEAIASLQSPHTVYLYDFGSAEDGRFYYAMELLDGISLQSLVSTFGPQPAERVVPILIAICESLEEAHRQGLVHRDLKPSNAMLCKVGLTYDFVKVLDFGLAKFLDRPELSQLTLEGTATGTAGYIAPEVAIGERSIDGRADLYALGCIAYFLLTGTLVFDDVNPMKMVLRHVKEAPLPPSARTTQAIPDALERIVLHCLAKSPRDRPTSAAAVARMLSACPVDPWNGDAAEAWWNRHLPATSPLRTFASQATGPASAAPTVPMTE